MPLPAWETRQISEAGCVAAPDGSEVRILCAVRGGSSALFILPPGAVARAVVHRTVDEIWYVVAGQGRLWRRRGAHEEVVDLVPGVSLTIPVGTEFQFRNDGAAPLEIFGVTMPPWPGEDEAERGCGKWATSL
ncbi:MAG TPA: cupin domain-containing protein [Stellaceae bacterium]